MPNPGSSVSRKFVFLDRDGTVNRDPGKRWYVKKPEDFEFIPGSVEAIKRLSQAGYSIVIFSNQAGVGKGLMTTDDLARIDAKMKDGVTKAGGKIDRSLYCTDAPEAATRRRKPGIGMLEEAVEGGDWDRKASVVIGDTERDIEAATAFGVRSVLVLCGKTNAGDEKKFKSRPTHVAADLVSAADWVLR